MNESNAKIIAKTISLVETMTPFEQGRMLGRLEAMEERNLRDGITAGSEGEELKKEPEKATA